MFEIVGRVPGCDGKGGRRHADGLEEPGAQLFVVAGQKIKQVFALGVAARLAPEGPEIPFRGAEGDHTVIRPAHVVICIYIADHVSINLGLEVSRGVAQSVEAFVTIATPHELAA